LPNAQLPGSPIQRTIGYADKLGDRRLANNLTRNSTAGLHLRHIVPENRTMSLTETALAQTRMWHYAYDTIGRLQMAARDDDPQYDYALDLADNIQRITDPNGTRRYADGLANKIAQAPYQDDALGNVIEECKCMPDRYNITDPVLE
jgi:hypothetical protein